MATVALCDDHPFMMVGQQRMLEGLGHQVLRHASNGRELVQFYKQTPVDLVIMDIHMPKANGIDALTRLREISLGVKVIIQTMYEDVVWIARAFTTGANAYLTKDIQAEEFGHALNTVLAGKSYLNILMSAEEFREAMQEEQRKRNYLGEPVLSTREREVLQLIGEGFSHKQIAGELNLSIHTVRDHQEHVKKVLGVTTNAGLVKSAVKMGLTTV
ncbi:MAG TPA: response regulator transcription factor [Nitrospira sp.]|nr:response regulator transcription factor [Nitrospira sp.]